MYIIIYCIDCNQYSLWYYQTGMAILCNIFRKRLMFVDYIIYNGGNRSYISVF